VADLCLVRTFTDESLHPPHTSGPLAEFGVNGKITLSGGDNIRENEDSKRDIAADRIPVGTRILELEHTNNLRPGIVKGPRSGVTVGNRGKALGFAGFGESITMSGNRLAVVAREPGGGLAGSTRKNKAACSPAEDWPLIGRP
jgi:hypothetical protein